MFNFKVTLLAAATAAILAPLTASAAPSAVLSGGGATLPSNAYVGNSWILGPVGGPVPSPTQRLSTQGDAGSLFGQYSASTPASQGLTQTTLLPFPSTNTRPLVSYCQTGSGDGRKMLTGTLVASHPCGDYSVAPSTTARNYQPVDPVSGLPNGDKLDGFGAGTSEPQFAGSDAPMSSSDYNTYITNKGFAHSYPVQFPAIAGAVAVIYNNVATGSTIGGAPIILTESKICGVFSGRITNWNELGAYPSKPIKVVVRSDSSGTTFSMTNHLSRVCGDSTLLSPDPIDVGFSTQNTFSPAAFPSGVLPVSIGANLLTASGNGGVVQKVFDTDGAFGYAEISDAVNQAALNPAHPQIQYVTIKLKSGINPTTLKPYTAKSPLKLGKTFKLATGGLLLDTVLGANDVNGRPTKATLSSLGITTPVAACVQLADPDAYATSGRVSGNYASYPIMAVSYLLGHGAGNGADDALNLRALFAAPYGTSNLKTTTTTVGQTKGYAYLTGFPNPTKAIKSCINP